jgi:hypothetical protein
MGVTMLLFVAAQGGVVFAVAWWLTRRFGAGHASAKATAMAVSYAAWIGLTVLVYALLGGEGGLMDGFGLLLFLCFTALVSSLVYLVVWTLTGVRAG